MGNCFRKEKKKQNKEKIVKSLEKQRIVLIGILNNLQQINEKLHCPVEGCLGVDICFHHNLMEHRHYQ